MFICTSAASDSTDAAGPAQQNSTKPAHRLTRFIGIGGIATAVQLGLLAGLSVVIDETWANLLSWAVSTIIANAAHRAVTFGIHDRAGARRDLAVATGFSILALVVSTALLHQLEVAGPLGAVLVLVMVNTAVGGLRYLALRWWFDGHTGSAPVGTA